MATSKFTKHYNRVDTFRIQTNWDGLAKPAGKVVKYGASEGFTTEHAFLPDLVRIESEYWPLWLSHIRNTKNTEHDSETDSRNALPSVVPGEDVGASLTTVKTKEWLANITKFLENSNKVKTDSHVILESKFLMAFLQYTIKSNTDTNNIESAFSFLIDSETTFATLKTGYAKICVLAGWVLKGQILQKRSNTEGALVAYRMFETLLKKFVLPQDNLNSGLRHLLPILENGEDLWTFWIEEGLSRLGSLLWSMGDKSAAEVYKLYLSILPHTTANVPSPTFPFERKNPTLNTDSIKPSTKSETDINESANSETVNSTISTTAANRIVVGLEATSAQSSQLSLDVLNSPSVPTPNITHTTPGLTRYHGKKAIVLRRYLSSLLDGFVDPFSGVLVPEYYHSTHHFPPSSTSPSRSPRPKSSTPSSPRISTPATSLPSPMPAATKKEAMTYLPLYTSLVTAFLPFPRGEDTTVVEIVRLGAVNRCWEWWVKVLYTDVTGSLSEASPSSSDHSHLHPTNSARLAALYNLVHVLYQGAKHSFHSLKLLRYLSHSFATLVTSNIDAMHPDEVEEVLGGPFEAYLQVHSKRLAIEFDLELKRREDIIVERRRSSAVDSPHSSLHSPNHSAHGPGFLTPSHGPSTPQQVNFALKQNVEDETKGLEKSIVVPRVDGEHVIDFVGVCIAGLRTYLAIASSGHSFIGMNGVDRWSEDDLLRRAVEFGERAVLMIETHGKELPESEKNNALAKANYYYGIALAEYALSVVDASERDSKLSNAHLVLTKSCTLDPASFVTLYGLARVEALQGNLASASTNVNNSIKKRSTYLPCWHLLSMVLEAQGAGESSDKVAHLGVFEFMEWMGRRGVVVADSLSTSASMSASGAGGMASSSSKDSGDDSIRPRTNTVQTFNTTASFTRLLDMKRVAWDKLREWEILELLELKLTQLALFVGKDEDDECDDGTSDDDVKVTSVVSTSRHQRLAEGIEKGNKLLMLLTTVWGKRVFGGVLAEGKGGLGNGAAKNGVSASSTSTSLSATAASGAPMGRIDTGSSARTNVSTTSTTGSEQGSVTSSPSSFLPYTHLSSSPFPNSTLPSSRVLEFFIKLLLFLSSLYREDGGFDDARGCVKECWRVLERLIEVMDDSNLEKVLFEKLSMGNDGDDGKGKKNLKKKPKAKGAKSDDDKWTMVSERVKRLVVDIRLEASMIEYAVIKSVNRSGGEDACLGDMLPVLDYSKYASPTETIRSGLSDTKPASNATKPVCSTLESIVHELHASLMIYPHSMPTKIFLSQLYLETNEPVLAFRMLSRPMKAQGGTIVWGGRSSGWAALQHRLMADCLGKMSLGDVDGTGDDGESPSGGMKTPRERVLKELERALKESRQSCCRGFETLSWPGVFE